MNPGPVNTPDKGGERSGNSIGAIQNGSVFSYNLDDTKTPGGLKVRWKVRVVTGPEADRHEARLAQALREALIWAQQHLT
jgi:hypothetical protein